MYKSAHLSKTSPGASLETLRVAGVDGRAQLRPRLAGFCWVIVEEFLSEFHNRDTNNNSDDNNNDDDDNTNMVSDIW